MYAKTRGQLDYFTPREGADPASDTAIADHAHGVGSSAPAPVDGVRAVRGGLSRRGHSVAGGPPARGAPAASEPRRGEPARDEPRGSGRVHHIPHISERGGPAAAIGSTTR